MDPAEPCLPLFRAPLPHPCRNSSTMDLTLFAAEAIALNRQLSQHEENEQNKLAEECEALAEGLCSVKLSPPSKSLEHSFSVKEMGCLLTHSPFR